MQPNSRTRSILRIFYSLLYTDFCPGANVYVYWLREPVGWFVIALISSVLIGAFFSPVGWSMAAGLAVVLFLGLGFPWLATRVLSCKLRCESEELYEGEEACLLLSVRNPLPIPVLGLVIENYFRVPVEDEEFDLTLRQGDCGLARVPAFSSAEYRLPIQPEFRGHYPNGDPVLACAFPFGIYTSRRAIASVQTVLVRPHLLALVAECEFSGAKLADAGEGNRPSNHGDFLGVREFQRGDSLRSIHWVQSARLDELVVCERGGPQKSPLKIHLFTARCAGKSADARDNLAWRVRIAATLVDLLSARHIPFELWIDDEQKPVPVGKASAGAAWDHLALVPLDSPEPTSATGSRSSTTRTPLQGTGFAIHCFASCASSGTETVLDHRLVGIEVRLRETTQGVPHPAEAHQVDLDQGIDRQLEQILQEASRDCVAA